MKVYHTTLDYKNTFEFNRNVLISTRKQYISAPIIITRNHYCFHKIRYAYNHKARSFVSCRLINDGNGF